MMKVTEISFLLLRSHAKPRCQIPIPLASAEVELVSRRARDRWFQQDSTTVAASFSPDPGASSRSSSPTNETIYAGTTTPAANGNTTPVSNGGTTGVLPRPVLNIVTRDALDHGARCGSCNEWIMGKRFQCANCPSDPVPYNLVRLTARKDDCVITSDWLLIRLCSRPVLNLRAAVV